MKNSLLALALLSAGLALADESAQIVGPVADGTPAPPPPDPVTFEIRPEDVISSKVRDFGDHTITIEKVIPIELPEAPAVQQRAEPSEEQKAAILAHRQEAQERVFLMMSITAFRSTQYSGGVRTQFRWWSKDRSREIVAWSNVDGSWLSGFGEFKSGGKRYCLLLGIGEQDVEKWSEALARHGKTYFPPEIPEIPQTGPSFVITSGNPEPDEVATIQAIHDLVRNEGERLRLACEGRKQAQKEHEEYLRNNPPKPKSLTVRYWRVDQAGQGGSNPNPSGDQ